MVQKGVGTAALKYLSYPFRTKKNKKNIQNNNVRNIYFTVNKNKSVLMEIKHIYISVFNNSWVYQLLFRDYSSVFYYVGDQRIMGVCWDIESIKLIIT